MWTSPTANMAYDFGLAGIAILFVIFEGIRRRGFKEYFKSFVLPWAMAPMNILEESDQSCVAFALRLYGNIYAGEVLCFSSSTIISTKCICIPYSLCSKHCLDRFLCIYFMLTELCICYVWYLCIWNKKINGE